MLARYSPRWTSNTDVLASFALICIVRHHQKKREKKQQEQQQQLQEQQKQLEQLEQKQLEVETIREVEEPEVTLGRRQGWRSFALLLRL